MSCIDKESGLLLLNPFLFLSFASFNTSSYNTFNNNTSFTYSLSSSLSAEWLQDQTDQLRGERYPRQ